MEHESGFNVQDGILLLFKNKAFEYGCAAGLYSQDQKVPGIKLPKVSLALICQGCDEEGPGGFRH